MQTPDAFCLIYRNRANKLMYRMLTEADGVSEAADASTLMPNNNLELRITDNHTYLAYACFDDDETVTFVSEGSILSHTTGGRVVIEAVFDGTHPDAEPLVASLFGTELAYWQRRQTLGDDLGPVATVIMQDGTQHSVQ